MALYAVHVFPHFIEYRAHFCSKATFFYLICLALTLILPLLIAYRSEGFWKRTDWYTEQPEINFKKEILVWLELADGIDYIAWSTFNNLNQLLGSHSKVPLIRMREEDWNRDGLKDTLDFSLEFPLSSEKVLSATLILLFDYQLKKFSRLQMEGMAYFQENSPVNGLEWKIVADLTLRQKIPLPHTGLYTIYNIPIFSSESVSAEDFEIGHILDKYSERNVTSGISNHYSVWKSGRGSNQPFKIHLKLSYPQQLILYKLGFWQMLKWAWVQYFSILLVFLFILNSVKTFVFRNQLLETLVQPSYKPSKY